MALRGDRVEARTDISFFMNETGEQGNVLIFENDGSGSAMDDPSALVRVSHATSGQRVIGILMNKVVDLDLTRQHLNQHQDEMQVGGKVTILTKGTIVTDRVDGTPSGGEDAYFANNGSLTTTIPTDDTAANENSFYRVGRFLGGVDNDGFAKVEIDIL